MNSLLLLFNILIKASATFGVRVATVHPSQQRVFAFCGRFKLVIFFIRDRRRLTGIAAGSPCSKILLAVV